MKTNGKFYMAGTEGTGRYIVVATTARGRVGLRPLGCETEKVTQVSLARVRVEPPVGKPKVLADMAAVLDAKKGWKQPGQDGKHRFSTVVEGGGKKLKNRLSKALAAIGAGDLKTEVNPDAPHWARSLIAA